MKRYCIMLFVVIALLFLNIGTSQVFADDCPCKREQKLPDQDFGLALTPDDILSSMMAPWVVHDYFRPWRFMASVVRNTGSTIKAEKDKFQINLDVQHFSPNEIVVKTTDGYVIVEAKHEDKKDEHGFISRQFVRKYSLPNDIESENVVSELSSDGILTITAPKKVVDEKGERIVPITQTGPVRKEVKDTDDNKGTCEASGQSCDSA